MNKNNVKRFWNNHKKVITKTVIWAITPVPVIIAGVVVNKILDKQNKNIFDKLEKIIRDEA